MEFNFKYKRRKEPLYDNQFSPGRINSLDKVENGKQGEKGKPGSTLYFINYEPDNDYVKNLVLNKIDNNVVLSSDKGLKLPDGKEYHEGDLILSNQYFVYRLIKADNDSNHKFDIEFVGEIIDRSLENLSEEEMLDRMIQSISLNEDVSQQASRRRSLTVISRSMDASLLYPDSSSYTQDSGDEHMIIYECPTGNEPSLPFTKADDTMTCIPLKPAIIIDNTLRSQASNYDFYLKIYLKNEKSPICNAATLNENKYLQSDYDVGGNNTISPLQDTFRFYKYIEFPLFKCYTNDTSTLYVPPIHITDMACDKLHPSGNEFTTNFYTAGNMPTYKSFTDSYTWYLGNFKFVSLYSPSNIKLASISTRIEGRPTYIQYKKSIRNDITSSYKNSQKEGQILIQYATRFLKETPNAYHIVKCPNYRSGESSYFSGIVPAMFTTEETYPVNGNEYSFFNESIDMKFYYSMFTDCRFSFGDFDNYVTMIRSINQNINMLTDSNLCVVDKEGTGSTYGTESNDCIQARLQATIDMVKEEMENFIFSEHNLYELICVNKTTGRILNKSITSLSR